MPSFALAFVTALALSALLTPLCVRAAFRWGVLDHPSPRKVHARPMPRLGGLAVFVAFAGATVLFMRPVVHDQMVLLLAGAAAFFVIGLVDDLKASGPWKLVAEALVVVAIVWLGDFRVNLPWPYVGQFLAVLWIVGASNAFNCLDCVDGVASGAGAIAALAIIPIALFEHRIGVAVGAAAAAGAMFGFLRYNYPPARIFLGDSGSLTLGFLVAGLGAAVVSPHPAPVAWCVPALIVCIPTVDFLLVHIRRYQGGMRNPVRIMTSTGKDHLPHRLASMGLSTQAVAHRIYAASALVAGSAVALFTLGTLDGLVLSIPATAAALAWSSTRGMQPQPADALPEGMLLDAALAAGEIAP